MNITVLFGNVSQHEGEGGFAGGGGVLPIPKTLVIPKREGLKSPSNYPQKRTNIVVKSPQFF